MDGILAGVVTAGQGFCLLAIMVWGRDEVMSERQGLSQGGLERTVQWAGRVSVSSSLEWVRLGNLSRT